MPFSQEEITSLAFKIYRKNQSVENGTWRLAKLCVTINTNIKDGYNITPLETDNLILLLREDVNGELIPPPEDEIREVAATISSEEPSRSQLDWYIAEKQLLLEEIQNIINRKK